ncbi:MAG: peptidylprolyl isomerase [Anaerolineales bacterium]|nr:peptidylprolyl isomerase [Anaerolineales bacterium]
MRRALWRQGFAVWVWVCAALAACGPAATPTATLPPVTPPTAAPPTLSNPIPTAYPTKPPVTPTLDRLFATPEGTAQPSLFAPVSDADWQVGPADAAVTVIEYSDFECEYCAAVAGLLRQLRAEFPADLRLVFRHYPLPQHPKARLAAAAAEAAGAQGAFWEMHDQLFERQTEWSTLTVEGFRAALVSYAAELELDAGQFEADLDDPATAARVQAAYETARDIPLPGAPFLLWNGGLFPDEGLTSHFGLSTLIRLERLKARQYTAPPPDVIDPFKTYTATLHTAKGEIVIQLFAEQTPLTVNNFVFLARAGWYDGVTFHRVITGFAAQTGDPSGTGYGGPGYVIPDEFVPELRYDAAGWVGMSNTGPDTNGSQFFISLTALPEYNGRYPLFGKVIAGLEVVEALTPRDPNAEADAPPGDVITRVTIEEQ